LQFNLRLFGQLMVSWEAEARRGQRHLLSSGSNHDNVDYHHFKLLCKIEHGPHYLATCMQTMLSRTVARLIF
jgi:hypothetical protein